MKQTKIVGSGWKVYVDDQYGIWRGEGDGFEVPLKMLLGHIPSDKIRNYSDTATYYGRDYGLMYPDAAKFLNDWGVKCSIENLPPIIFEELKTPDQSPD